MKKIIFNRPVITILILYIFVIIILNYCGYFLPEKNSCLLQQTTLKQVELTGKVITSPIQKDDKQQFILEVYNVNDKQIKKEKTLVYLSSIYNVNYGDIICGSGKINIPQKPTFPYNFDYNLYLQQDNIYTIFYQQNFELVDEKANEMFDRLVKQFAKQEGVTEQLKAEDQMLWVRKMNNIRNRATEIVNKELIYT